MPLAVDLPAKENPACHTRPAVWFYGVKSTNYHRWLRESEKGIHGAFRAEVSVAS